MRHHLLDPCSAKLCLIRLQIGITCTRKIFKQEEGSPASCEEEFAASSLIRTWSGTTEQVSRVSVSTKRSGATEQLSCVSMCMPLSSLHQICQTEHLIATRSDQNRPTRTHPLPFSSSVLTSAKQILHPALLRQRMACYVYLQDVYAGIHRPGA